MAPYVVSQALMGAIYCARMFEKMGYEVLPKYDDVRSDIEMEYLYYCLKHYDFNNVISGSAQPQIVRESLKNVNVVYPIIPVQRRIAATLDKVSEGIALCKQMLVDLDELVKSQFVEMFGNTILNPFGWEKNILGSVCDVRDGTHDSPQYYETGYPLVTSKNVTVGKIDLTGCSLICEADFKKINERSKVDILSPPSHPHVMNN